MNNTQRHMNFLKTLEKWPQKDINFKHLLDSLMLKLFFIPKEPKDKKMLWKTSSGKHY